ncbi:MAG: AraD1 family protein [Geminicoccaceae bacterium]
MNIVQLKLADGTRAVGIVDGNRLALLDGVASTLDLARQALAAGTTLASAAEKARGTRTEDYQRVIDERRLLSPVDHPDPAHLLVTGTGLTHLGSAATRDAMHAVKESDLTDSMKMFKMGLEGGRPAAGGIGVQPEWFFKGDGSTVVAPEADITMPGFSLDGGEEPEIAGIYFIADDGTPCRLGFALGNEFSDHVTERINYLFLAHSKLRLSAFGPELRLGDLPGSVEGTSAIRRGGEVVWSKPFKSGEANMSHTLGNLEHHHFKYAAFRRPGDVHVHYFGTATLSFADGIKPQPGDRFEIGSPDFGRPLRNTLQQTPDEGLVKVRPL